MLYNRIGQNHIKNRTSFSSILRWEWLLWQIEEVEKGSASPWSAASKFFLRCFKCFILRILSSSSLSNFFHYRLLNSVWCLAVSTTGWALLLTVLKQSKYEYVLQNVPNKESNASLSLPWFILNSSSESVVQTSGFLMLNMSFGQASDLKIEEIFFLLYGIQCQLKLIRYHVIWTDRNLFEKTSFLERRSVFLGDASSSSCQATMKFCESQSAENETIFRKTLLPMYFNISCVVLRPFEFRTLSFWTKIRIFSVHDFSRSSQCFKRDFHGYSVCLALGNISRLLNPIICLHYLLICNSRSYFIDGFSSMDCWRRGSCISLNSFSKSYTVPSMKYFSSCWAFCF